MKQTQLSTIVSSLFIVLSVLLFPPQVSAADSYSFSLCAQAGTELGPECLRCLTGQSDLTSLTDEQTQEPQGIWTAAGCIPVTQDGMTKALIRLSLGFGGGFALMFILYGSVVTTISTGDPQQLKHGQEIITAAISGLLFIILSIALLQFIGVQILQIPGLSS